MARKQWHKHVPLDWYHQVPDSDLEELNWALEVAYQDTSESPTRVYYVIQSEMARRGLATSKSQLWLAAWQKKQNQKNKPSKDTHKYVILGKKKTK